jgi:molybdate transport system ATP-binding protein
VIELAFDIRVAQGAFALEVADRSRVEVLGLVGPSGAGKTTLLETIAGLRKPSRGEIVVDGVVLFSMSRYIDVPPRHRRIGYVPQDALLFPHLSVRGNLLFGLKAQAPGPGPQSSVVSRQAPGSRPRTLGMEVHGVAAMLEIEHLLDRRVQDLSGGERQRVALGRALMTHPALLLMDEPLAAVDRARRERILPYLLRIRRELHVPLIYVTHDTQELEQIADRILVISDGRVEEIRQPR